MGQPQRVRSLRGAVAPIAALLAMGACSITIVSEDAASTAQPGTGTGSTDVAIPVMDSSRVDGVTDDTLLLGLALIDAQDVLDTFGVELGYLPEEVIGALVDSVNAEGGINGRRVEVVERHFMPIGTEHAEAACRELIEDNGVFAVIGQFIGDDVLCVTETNGTPYIGLWGLNAQRRERSRAPLVTAMPEVGVELHRAVDVLVDEGLLDGARVAVYYEPTESTATIETGVVEPLRDAGIDVVGVAQLPDSNDAVQAGTNLDRILQRFEADGADVFISAGAGAGVLLPALERSSWDAQLMFLVNGQYIGEEALPNFGLTDPNRLEGAIAMTSLLTPDEAVADPGVRACIETINEFSDLELVPEDIYPTSVRPDSLGADLVPDTCRIWSLAVQVLTAAGDDPSPQSIVDGLAELESFSLPGYPEVSLAPDRWGGIDALRVWEYDREGVRFLPAGTAGPGRGPAAGGDAADAEVGA